MKKNNLPSVTQIINMVIGREFYADEWYMQRGIAIHKAMELLIQNKLDWSSVDERILKRVKMGERAIKELKFIPPFETEIFLTHPLYQFCGKIDLLTGDGILVDWKSSQSYTDDLQLGGYYLLCSGNNKKVRKICSIVLKEDKYEVFEYDKKKTSNLFLSCLNLYNFLKEKGGEKEWQNL